MKRDTLYKAFCFLMLNLFCFYGIAQPAWSRGIQILTFSHDEGMRRIQRALEAEGYGIQNRGGDFMAGQKNIHSAVITCNAIADGRAFINIFVASTSNDAGVPGAERVRLQARMDQSLVDNNTNFSGNLIGEWNIKCCNDELTWTSLSITKQDGNTFSGSFSGEYGGGVVANGQVRGNTIEFDRFGSGLKQHWSAQLVRDGGGIRMINGIWTGDYQDRYPSRNNFHAEMKSNSSGMFIGEWNIKCCNDDLTWTSLNITQHDGTSFSGTFSGEHGGGAVANGQIRGNTVQFDRIGSGWKQHWSGQLVNDNGRLRIINGVWSGDHLDRFPGRNNWRAEKK